jgi:hypothetical protein
MSKQEFVYPKSATALSGVRSQAQFYTGGFPVAPPRFANPSPFDIINGVAYRRDRYSSIDAMIIELATPGFSMPKRGRRDG